MEVVHVFDVLEAVAQVAKEGMVDMFKHSALTNDVAYALGSDDYDERNVSC